MLLEFTRLWNVFEILEFYKSVIWHKKIKDIVKENCAMLYSCEGYAS